MAQTHVLAAHLDNHGDLIADPNTPSDHLIATFPVEAFEELWEDKGWVLVNRNGEAVDTLEDADPDSPANTGVVEAGVDRAALRRERSRKFTRAKATAKAPSKTTAEA